MKTKLPRDELTYGVLLSALASFAFATVLDSTHVGERANPQPVPASTVVAAQVAPALASATQATPR